MEAPYVSTHDSYINQLPSTVPGYPPARAPSVHGDTGNIALVIANMEQPRLQVMKECLKEKIKRECSAVTQEMEALARENDEKLGRATKDIAEKVDAVSQNIAAIKAVQEAEVNLRRERDRAAELIQAKEEGRAEERKRLQAVQRNMVMFESLEQQRRKWEQDFSHFRQLSPDDVETQSSESTAATVDWRTRCPASHTVFCGSCLDPHSRYGNGLV